MPQDFDVKQLPFELDTLRRSFEESQSVVGTLFSWADGLDTKIVAVFTFSTTIAGIVPLLSLLANVSFPDWLRPLWAAAGVFWLTTVLASIQAYRVRTFEVGPDPAKLKSTGWLALDEAKYIEFRIDVMGRQSKKVRCLLTQKARWLKLALIALTAQILVLAIAVTIVVALGRQNEVTHPCVAETKCQVGAEDQG